ncbi:MAG: hypothetical protein QM622_05065 [Microbacterium sp.]
MGVGIKKLGAFAESAATALSGIADAFESVDNELASALEQHSSESSSQTRTGRRSA